MMKVLFIQPIHSNGGGSRKLLMMSQNSGNHLESDNCEAKFGKEKKYH